MSKSTVAFITPAGEIKDYKLLSARIPDFLKAFPKEDGYRVKVETYDPLSIKPGLLKLYDAAISAGKNPQDVGLPPLPSGDSVIFRASLVDKDGNVLESASALRAIYQYKDWEKGETAARQRLVAALGFGGESFDEDEEGDMVDQNLKAHTKSKIETSKPSLATVSKETSADAAPVESENAASTESVPLSQQEVSNGHASNEAQKTEEVETLVAPEERPEKKSAAADDAEEIPPRLIRQIEHQAKLKGKENEVDVGNIKTVKEAKQILKNLMRS